MSNAQESPHPEFHLGDRMRKAREEAGVGVAEMALRLGVSRNTITNWERGHNIPQANYIEEYQKHTGVSVGWLITAQYPELLAA